MKQQKRIKIAVDIRDLKIARTGTQTYLSELCREFRLLANDDTQFFFFDTALPIYRGEKKLLKLVEHVRYQIWKQIVLPLKAWLKGCDIIFCTDNYVPLLNLGYKTVPVFHDAFFFENPEHFNKYWLWLYRKLAIPAAKRSPIVVTPTYYARKQIHFYTGIRLENLVVIYEGPKSLKKNITKENMNNTFTNSLAHFNLQNEQYILHVGVMNKRKNIPALIRAFKQLKNKRPSMLKLVLVGHFDQKIHSSDYEEIMKAVHEGDFKEDIVFPGYLSNEELSIIYAQALMYVFPSINEGFGIPILEAWSFNLPVLVANNTCLPEVGGEAVLPFDPFDTNDIALKMESIYSKTELRHQLIEKGHRRLKEFTWKKAAESLIKEFESIVR